MAVQAIVADPEFVFRFERTPRGVAPGSNYRISGSGAGFAAFLFFVE